MPRLVELFLSLLDFEVSFAHVLRRSDSFICVFDLYTIPEPLPSYSFARKSPWCIQILLEVVPPMFKGAASLLGPLRR